MNELERKKIRAAIAAGEARGFALMAKFVGVDERTLRRAYEQGVPEVRAAIRRMSPEMSALIRSPYDEVPRPRKRQRGERGGVYVADPGELLNLIPLFMDRREAGKFGSIGEPAWLRTLLDASEKMKPTSETG